MNRTPAALLLAGDGVNEVPYPDCRDGLVRKSEILETECENETRADRAQLHGFTELGVFDSR